MGVGEYLSGKAEREYIAVEYERERREVAAESMLDNKKRWLVDTYCARGLPRRDAVDVVERFARSPDFFVTICMQELGHALPGDGAPPGAPDAQAGGSGSPVAGGGADRRCVSCVERHCSKELQDGTIMFCSFIFFGLMPLLGYIIFPAVLPDLSSPRLFQIACAVTVVTLFALGAMKGAVTNGGAAAGSGAAAAAAKGIPTWIKSGLTTAMLGGTCAYTAFFIGQAGYRVVNG
jgi:DNA damage-binding protein 1